MLIHSLKMIACGRHELVREGSQASLLIKPDSLSFSFLVSGSLVRHDVALEEIAELSVSMLLVT